MSALALLHHYCKLESVVINNMIHIHLSHFDAPDVYNSLCFFPDNGRAPQDQDRHHHRRLASTL